MKKLQFLISTASVRCLHAAFLLLGATASTLVYAQPTIVPPTLVDNQLSNFGNAGVPNSSTISYANFCTGTMPCATTNKQLTALVADDGVNATIYVNDQVVPVPVPWASAPIPAPGGCAPDVVIGNDIANPGLYIAGVVVVTGGNVVLYLYHVVGVGTGGVTIIGPPYATVNITTAGNAVAPAHIDGIGEYSTPFFGLPRVNKFAITWKDNTMGIMGYFGSLNAPAGPTMIINPNLNLSNPDVAAVERAGLQDWALFSYVDLTAAPNKLFYQEWRMSPLAGPLAPVLYDNTKFYANPYPGMVSVLRIDGIDDFTKNMVPGPNAIFDIATSAPGPGNSIWEYNNKTGPFVANNITAPVVLPAPGLTNQQSTIPAVACGPGNFYSIGYYSVLPPSGGFQDYFATAIDWATGKPTTDPNAYQINSMPYDIMFNPGIALSGTSNTDVLGVQDLFVGWENYNILFYKYSLPVAPYAFKHEGANGAPAIENASSEWQLYPNPADDHITLSAPAGFVTNESTTYHITDLSGRSLLHNTIHTANEQINVSALPAGMYLVNVYANEMTVKTIKFVKE